MMAENEEDRAFTRDSILDAARNGELEEHFRQAGLYLEDAEWKAFIATTMDMQRTGEIDLLCTMADGEGPIDHFAGQLYQVALPTLDVPASAMLTAANKVVERHDDGAVPYFLFDVVADYCAKDPARVEAAINAIRSGDAPASLRIATLQAGLRADRTTYLDCVARTLTTGSDEEAVAAGFVLGTVDAADSTEAKLIADTLETAMASDRSAVRLAGLSAGLSIGTRDPAHEVVALAVIDGIGADVTPEMRKAVATGLFLARKNPSTELVERMCGILAGTGKEEAETIAAIDNAVAQHLTGPTAAPRLALIENLLRRGVTRLRKLKATRHYIISDKGGLLATLATDWISDGSNELIEAVHDLVSAPALDCPTLDLDFGPKLLTVEQTLASARKVVARLVIHPVTAASVLLSLLRTGPRDAGAGLEKLLYEPILLSYWDLGREYLAEASPTQPHEVQERITRLIEALDAHVGAIKATGFITELRPSERHRFLQQILRLENNAKIQKAAQKQSIFADLIPTSVLLYGDSVVSEVHLGDGRTQRTEFRLGVVEHSIPLATLDAIDPVGFWYQRLVLSMGRQP